MRRILGILVVLVIAAAGVVLLLATREEEEPYLVRAIFDNASFVIPGEEVRIGGARVGTIDEVGVSPDKKAVVVIEIEEEGFKDFREDARCLIRPQSLIGEKFVECTPTEAGSENPPPLRRIEEGEGAGQRLLPVERTSTPVDLDLINNIMRRPFRERLALVVNELGTGLAGRGEELRQVIRRANPALQETDRVVQLLSEQSDVLEDLAVNSDRVLEPLARDRERVSSFITNANETAQATAARRTELERTIERLPAFLRELDPTMRRLASLATTSTPVLRDLEAAAPDLNRVLNELGPFSQAGIPAVESLGDAAEVGTPAMRQIRPTIRELRTLARSTRPVAENLDALTGSLRRTGGLERVLDYFFYQVAAINGFDDISHYLRAGLIVNQCASYATEPTPGCSANFDGGGGGGSARASGSGGRRSPNLERIDKVLRGADPEKVMADEKAEKDGSGKAGKVAARQAPAADTGSSKTGALRMPGLALPGRLGSVLGGEDRAAKARGKGAKGEAGSRKAPAPRRPAGAPDPSDPEAQVLDYLLGSDG